MLTHVCPVHWLISTQECPSEKERVGGESLSSPGQETNSHAHTRRTLSKSTGGYLLMSDNSQQWALAPDFPRGLCTEAGRGSLLLRAFS